jgi:aryl-alcohol dehydrogenase-like predicted oxidoreductase
MAANTTLFDPIFDGVEVGIGTWAWGDRFVWGYGNKYHEEDIVEAFQQSIESKVVFFDTAEVYGQGKSESFLGKMIPSSNSSVKVASKFMPFPWRLGKSALKHALHGSLNRLKLDKIDLYQMHWPLLPVPVERWMDQMASVYQEGLIKAVGVSNYDLNQTKRSVIELQKYGIRLASNQLEYHLLERRIEKNGLMDYCTQNGIKVIAYSPLAMGILSGKYTPENPPKGARASQYSSSFLAKIQPLIKMIKRIGQDHEGKTASQVALNWAICKGTLPIPGAKNAHQASENAGGTSWRLTKEEVQQLDEMSDSVSTVTKTS